MNPIQMLPGPPQAQRKYAGADYGRVLSDWITGNTSADAEIRSALATLRNRVRDMGRNNDYVVNALRAIQNNVIGQGVKMQAQVKRARGPGAGQVDDAANDAIESAWSRWQRADSCHTAGQLAFSDIERLLVRSVAESGEVFIRLIRQPFGRSRVPLALEIIEADQCDETLNGQNGSNQIRMGVEVDQWNRPQAYHFLAQHPGDIHYTAAGSVAQRRIRVPASEVIHLYRIERPGQTRGVPWFASALTRLRHMSGYEEAEVIAARATACQMGFIETPDIGFEPTNTMGGQRVEEFEPGKIGRLGPGEKFSSFNPTRPSGLLDPFMRYMLRGTAAGVGVSYETISKDYSQSNFSSSRLALLDDRDTWRQLQGWLIGAFHQRVIEAWMQMAVLAGELDLPNYESQRERYEAVRWMPRGWSWIDPKADVAAAKEAVRCGFTTQTDVIAQQGGDFEEVARARQREIQLAADLDLVFDTDPKLVSAQGQAQVDPSASQSGSDGAQQADQGAPAGG